MNYLQLSITVLGGLAIFIYGMGLMSDGLTQIAGARIKKILAYVTRNRVAAILAGTAVTALIQSSSATTVMTVGFVNAGLLSLQQAIGVIFGANIGTTVTGQLVSFKLDDLALPAIVGGVIGLMLARREITRGAWRTLLGFGFLFFGMTMMSHELKSVAKLPSFISFFSLFDCTPSASGFLPFGSILGAVAVGTLCTMLVQSSSATIGITIALAEAGLINIWTAVPIVLGDNIGTTITAALAAINANANARRTALAHALFNIIATTLLVTTFWIVFTDSAGNKAPGFFHLVNAVTEGNGLSGENPGRHVAMAHTLFNVTNVIILAFFLPLLAKLCQKIIADDRAAHTVTLEPHLISTPELALQAAINGLAEMTRRAWTASAVALNGCLGKASVDTESIQKVEKEIDAMQNAIRDYLIAVSQQKLTVRQAQMIPEILHCVNDAERISDIALKIHRKTDRMRSNDIPEDVLKDLLDVIAETRDLARGTLRCLKNNAPADGLREIEKRIHLKAKAVTRSFAEKIQNAEQNTTGGNVAFIAVLAGLRDISRHLGNIATRVPAFA